MTTDVLKLAAHRIHSTVIQTFLGRKPHLLQFYVEPIVNSNQWVLEPPFGYHVPKYGTVVISTHLSLHIFKETTLVVRHTDVNLADGFVELAEKPVVVWQESMHDASRDTTLMLDLRNERDPRKVLLQLARFQDWWFGQKHRFRAWSVDWPDQRVLTKLDEALDQSIPNGNKLQRIWKATLETTGSQIS